MRKIILILTVLIVTIGAPLAAGNISLGTMTCEMQKPHPPPAPHKPKKPPTPKEPKKPKAPKPVKKPKAPPRPPW